MLHSRLAAFLSSREFLPYCFWRSSLDNVSQFCIAASSSSQISMRMPTFGWLLDIHTLFKSILWGWKDGSSRGPKFSSYQLWLQLSGIRYPLWLQWVPAHSWYTLRHACVCIHIKAQFDKTVYVCVHEYQDPHAEAKGKPEVVISVPPRAWTQVIRHLLPRCHPGVLNSYVVMPSNCTFCLRGKAYINSRHDHIWTTENKVGWMFFLLS